MEKNEKIKIVVDTNVIFSALVKTEGITRLAISLLKQIKNIEIIAPREIINEIKIHRFEIARKAGINQKIFGYFLDAILKGIKIVETKETIEESLEYVKDEKDAPFVAACLKTKASFLMTYNKKDFRVKRLKKIGIDVLTPLEILKKLGIDIAERTEIKRKGHLQKMISKILLIFKLTRE